MKYYKLEYDMNRPSVKGISVPTDSDYGVAVKVYKDDIPTSGLVTIEDLSGTSGPDGYSLVELSSGGTGIYSLDVEVEVSPTACEDISTDNTYAATQMSEANYRGRLTAVKNYLSAGTLPEQITVGTDNLDFTGKYRIIKGEQVGEWIPYGGTAWRIEHIMSDGTKRMFLKTNDNRWQSYVGGEILYFDTITLNTETDSVTFASNTNINDTEPFNVQVVQTIVIDTKDGFSTKFDLQVCVSDKGYIEVKKEEPVESEQEEAVE